jgi:hypothetical protein
MSAMTPGSTANVTYVTLAGRVEFGARFGPWIRWFLVLPTVVFDAMTGQVTAR